MPSHYFNLGSKKAGFRPVFSLPGHMTPVVKAGWSCPRAAQLVQHGAKRAESSETSQQCVNNTDRPHHCATLRQRCGKHSDRGSPLRRNVTAFCGMLCVSASFLGGQSEERCSLGLRCHTSRHSCTKMPLKMAFKDLAASKELSGDFFSPLFQKSL